MPRGLAGRCRPIIARRETDGTTPIGNAPPRSRALRGVHEGVYIGTISVCPHNGGATLAANPHLKIIFGIRRRRREEVVPFAPERFVDAQRARPSSTAERGAVTDYLLRLRA